jgi:hypothetical protein
MSKADKALITQSKRPDLKEKNKILAKAKLELKVLKKIKMTVWWNLK